MQGKPNNDYTNAQISTYFRAIWSTGNIMNNHTFLQCYHPFDYIIYK